ncbi:MAG: malonyl-CoA decarboxylase family protein [Alphaproteobacteria bacterium]|nr:malonyl-CoA decarboxylase family protein [Alphaproteobacteria bacterium]
MSFTSRLSVLRDAWGKSSVAVWRERVRPAVGRFKNIAGRLPPKGTLIPKFLKPAYYSAESKLHRTRIQENTNYLDIYNKLHNLKKILNDPRQIELTEESIKEASTLLCERATLQRITPDSHPALIRQLHDNEAVHKCGRDELVSHRLGHEKTDKACFALVMETKVEPVILAGIFTYFDQTLDAEKGLRHKGLAGFVDHVKKQEPKSMTEAHDTAVFYTITSVFPGAGATLVQRVYQELHARFVLTTLSPIRSFTKDQDRTTLLGLDRSKLQAQVLSYLLENKDPVMKFHLGNGAYIGDIKINPDSAQDWITINYVYPVKPERLNLNRILYKSQGTIFLSPYLHEQVQTQMPEKLSTAQAFAGGDLIRYSPPTSIPPSLQ